MKNIAPQAYAFQSSLSRWSSSIDEANNALVGKEHNGYAFHTDMDECAWWICDLKQKFPVSMIKIYLRNGFEERNRLLNVSISNNLLDWKELNIVSQVDGDIIEASLSQEICRFVRIYVKNNYLHLRQVEVFVESFSGPLFNFRGCQLTESNLIAPRVMNHLKLGDYESTEIDIALAHVTRNDRVLELGASIGAVSSVIIAQRRPASYCAVEANPDLIPLIKCNHGLNNISCEIITGAIGNNDGSADFYIHPECWASSLVPTVEAIRIEKVKVLSFNKLLKQTRPTFISCEIEGGEYGIFNEKTDLSSVQKVCIEVHRVHGRKARELYNYFIANGFACDDPAPTTDWHHVYFFYRS